MDAIAKNTCEDRQRLMTAEEFSRDFREWIRAQQDDFEKNGLWSDGLVPWQYEGCSDGAS